MRVDWSKAKVTAAGGPEVWHLFVDLVEVPGNAYNEAVREEAELWCQRASR